LHVVSNLKLARASFALVALLAFAALAGCAPTVSRARVEQVKRVAVVGYETSEGSPLDARRAGAAGPRVPAAELCARLGAHLASAMGWQVVPAPEVAANPEVQRLQRVEGMGALAALSGAGSAVAPGLFSFQSANLLDAVERASLVKALGVDAVAVALVSLHRGSETVAPSGLDSRGLSYASTAEYSATTQFYLYDAAGLIWEDLQARGAPSRESGGAAIPGVLVEAVENSYAALVDRYHEASR
jgi:hypothetical protein